LLVLTLVLDQHFEVQQVHGELPISRNNWFSEADIDSFCNSYLTGVQLEVGNAATEFERRPFGQELDLCFRYFRRYASDASNHCLLPGYALANATTGGYGPVQLNPIMRANPTLLVSAAADLSVDTSGTAAALTAVSIYGGYTTKNSVLLNFTVASGLVNGQAYMFRVNSGTGKHASFSAEI
jgi:hypothetical protein